MELQQPHELYHAHNAALQPALWAEFSHRFLQSFAPHLRPDNRERVAVKEIVDQIQHHEGNRQFQSLLRSIPRTRFVAYSRNEEMRAMAQRFDGLMYHGDVYGALELEGVYGRYLRVLELFQHAYASAGKEGDPKQRQELRGRGGELIAAALVARLRHPNVTLAPVLQAQDSSAAHELNHDYLYIDTFGEQPLVQPTQVKLSLEGARREYSPLIAMVVGPHDLHTCPYEPTDKRQACPGPAECINTKTVEYLLQEDPSPEVDGILDALANGLILKLSSWHENPERWRGMIREDLLARDALARVRDREARRLRLEDAA